MAQQTQYNNNKRSATTDNLYQSTFLPIFENAGTRIKLMILTAFLLMTPKNILYASILKVIKNVEKKIPKDLLNRDSYINGLYTSASKMIVKYYDSPKTRFIEQQRKIMDVVPENIKPPRIDTPTKLVNYMNENKPQLDMWAEAKGTPYIPNYGREVNKTIDELSKTDLTTSEPGKKPISLWQKAELDVRYTHQIEMVDNLVADGVEYAWISSHPNCSKRCEKWQGKLVALTKHAVYGNFLVGQIDGNKVYSLTDIMAQVDKYGYNNNIICGFNCRHHLIPYKPDSKPPKKYSEEDIKKQREIEENIRKMERQIRATKQLYELEIQKIELYKKTNPKLALEHRKNAKILKERIAKMVETYKNYCERNGYAWEEYRIKVRN